jgi:hypothetical protein
LAFEGSAGKPWSLLDGFRRDRPGGPSYGLTLKTLLQHFEDMPPDLRSPSRHRMPWHAYDTSLSGVICLPPLIGSGLLLCFRR